MTRIFIALAVGLVVSLSGNVADAARQYAAIVVDHQTGKVLHSRRADDQLYPASMTKMMTLYMLFDALNRGELGMKSKLRVSRRAAGMPASRLGLGAGTRITVEAAIAALAVKSANDVAVVVAEALGGTESEFAVLMTRKARAMGMRNTTFKNASGLPNRHQKSSARDMATLSQRLITDFPEYYHYFSRSKFTYAGRTYRSHNRLLGNYRGMDGLKTGYIRAAGFNLAATAIRNGRRVIVVVFGGKSAKTRDRQVARLLDMGFERLPQMPSRQFEMPIARPGTATGPQLAANVPPPVLKPTSSISEAPTPKPAIVPNVAITNTPTVDVVAQSDSSPTIRPIVTTASAPASPSLSQQAALAIGAEKLPANGSYAVQVGAYHDHQKAREAAHRAAERVPQILLLGDIDISALDGRRKPVYRARLTGFSRDLADKACTLLRKQSHDCLVVHMPPA